MYAPRQEVIPEVFLNREIGWIEFNRRVLHEANDPRTPLLEKLRFLAIFTSNLDEFFMKRVGGLKRQHAAGTPYRSPDGLTSHQQLIEIRRAIIPLIQERERCYREIVRPALQFENINVLPWDELTDQERAFAHEYFLEKVFPILTPLAVDPGHPFPFLSNLSLSIGVLLRHPDRDETLFARVKVPDLLPRLVPFPFEESTDTFRFVSLSTIMEQNLTELFPGMVILNHMQFRVTRNANIERDEEDADDLLEMIEDELRKRRFARVVRLEHGPEPVEWMIDFLKRELKLEQDDVYELEEELDYASLLALTELNLPNLKFEPWVPCIPPALIDEEANIFGVIRSGDFLVHHPYESFSATVERFIRTAVEDPHVCAIKMTLYRVGEFSPFIPLLIRAADAGKHVVCVVEVKANFDEKRNIHWAHALEKAGIHVVYGIVGLKTHAKAILVVRKQGDGLECYAHIATGNYNIQTAKHYTDIGLFTCDKEITTDLVHVFNHLTGRSLKHDYRKLLVAPNAMRERFLEMIRREIEHQHAGRPAHIIAKFNNFEEHDIARALYDASREGVKIDLIVRGFCCLAPGIPGLSENIRVISTVGRYLEHSRLYYFRNGAIDPLDGEFYLGSADWMYRNLLGRVEVVVPIEDKSLRERCWLILRTHLGDRRSSWEMQSDGSYIQRQPNDEESGSGAQTLLMSLARRPFCNWSNP